MGLCGMVTWLLAVVLGRKGWREVYAFGNENPQKTDVHVSSPRDIPFGINRAPTREANNVAPQQILAAIILSPLRLTSLLGGRTAPSFLPETLIEDYINTVRMML